jgi:uncharacterized protein YkwD
MTQVRGPRPLSLLLVAVVLAAAGCQVPGARAQPSSPPTGSHDRRVQAADSKLYGGDYDGAETAYRALTRDEVVGAAAHLSTLLAYESRFAEAVAQAQAGVQTSADSDSLARLTRALDWSQDINGALAAGARAVAARPVHPLAHVFYAEALADAGRFDAALHELHVAEDTGGDAFVQAEIDREWANYYRGRRDSQSELNYTQLAIKAQPRFPERQLDLVRYDYGNQRPDVARSVADKLMAAHPQSYPLLIAVADSALIGGDTQRAPSLYKAAAAVRPDGAEAALGQAEIDVAVTRDFAGAHDLLLAALRRNPTSSGVYEYLRYLDLLVLKKDPAAELGAIAPERPADLTAGRKAVLDRLNRYRSAVGLAALQEDPALAEAAQAHAYFYLFNVGQAQLSGVAIHMEDPSLPGFSGARSIDRDRHFGYGGSRGGEVIDQVVSPSASIDDWIDSVFHRYPLMDRETSAVGYGAARVGALSIAVLDIGANPPGTGDPVVYPAPDQTDTPAAFVDSEVPDPLPQGALPPAGYPITLQFGGAQKLTVSSGRLLDAAGKAVASFTLAPGDQLTAAEWALVPRQPLKPGGRYTVDVSGTVDGKDFTKRWSFTVVGP